MQLKINLGSAYPENVLKGIAQIPSDDSGRHSMRRIRVLAFLLLLSSVGLIAAPNSQTFYLSADARAGGVHLPRGICEVTWSTPSGSQVQLTIKTEDKKTITVPARVVEGKQDRTGVITSVVNGVTYLDELHTRNAKFIFQNNTTEASK